MRTDSSGNNNSTGNIFDEFDREYALCELVSKTFFDSISEDIGKTGGINTILLEASGEICYSADPTKNSWQKRFTDAIKDKSRSKALVIPLEKNELLVPITHQLEVIGYLFLEFNPDPAWQNKNLKMIIETLIEKVLNLSIKNNYQTLLTSGLHTQVVEDSFYEINKKTILVAKSEEKYRLLAESLEKEVKIKAKEIKTTQTRLMHQEKLASIGQLAAGVAHEINNPMGFISSNLRTLKEYTKNLLDIIKAYRSYIAANGLETISSKTLNAIKTVEKQLDIDFILDDIPSLIDESVEGAGRVNKIVSDLKDFAHPGEEKPALTDINTCINSTLNIVWSEIKYKAEVKKQLTNIPQIYCFPQQLNQVIMNLLVNSAHTIEKRGEIVIETRDAGKFVEIKITDNGSGIPKENLRKIFDPFFTTKEIGKGTGLGLNLAYNIIQKHNGKIDVESTPGIGTRFIIKLPVDSTL